MTEIMPKHINTLCGQNGEPLVLKPGLETLTRIQQNTGFWYQGLTRFIKSNCTGPHPIV